MKFNDTAGTSNMNKTIPSTVTIHFIDGMTQCFEFEAPEIDPMTFASKLEKVLARNQIHIQLVDRVLVIPIQVPGVHTPSTPSVEAARIRDSQCPTHISQPSHELE